LENETYHLNNRRNMKSFLIALFVILGTISAMAQDTIRAHGAYLRTDFPYPGERRVENVNGFNVGVDVKVFKAGPFRGSVAYDFKQMNDVEVYPDYFDGMKVVDLYRNVRTHSGGGQIGFNIKDRVEPFAGLFYGVERVHPDAIAQTVRNVRAGINIMFSKNSKFFFKGALDFKRPYGDPMGGFINPATRTLVLGGGFRF
jgi:hypothetical protein